MTIIDLPAREAAETEILVLADELKARAEQGAGAAAIVAQIARRIAGTAETLARPQP
ncbi:MAG: hypothetical protein ACD_10C00377G0003 [uncultured bacterium]|nr:MAG: hypothetical protein ACD_10C00377G0003 [uncultured bacterium]